MGFFITLLIWSAVFVASELLRPKPNFEDARPSGLGDFRFPTATEGRPVPLVWGTVKLEAPNVVWYGNLRIERLTEEVKTGMFSSDTVTTGYNYFVGIQFALCRGPIFGIGNVWVDDKIASAGRVGAGIMSVTLDLGGERTGRGTLTGGGELYIGDAVQLADSYLAVHQVPTPAYRGTAYWVFQDGKAGSSTNIPKFAFEVLRFPDGLNLTSLQPGDEIVNITDCNPMNVIYEILTDTDWGLRIPTSSIDLAVFRAAAATLASEGNGWSMILDSEMESRDLLREVERQIDGIVYYERSTGLWQIKLARNDYVAGDLDLYDESNILDLSDYSRQSWEETTNQARLLFVDNQDNYKQTYALAQDMANVEIQGGNVSVDIRYPGVKNRALANRIAWRELATLSYPLARVSFSCNREGFQLLPGSVFRFSWAPLGLTDVVFRVVRLDPGNIDSEKIAVTAVEDIFVDGVAVFSNPPTTSWGDPELAPVAVLGADTLTFEAPRQMVVQDPFNAALQPRLWAGGRNPGGGTVAFQLYTRHGASRPLIGVIGPESTVGVFLLAGVLDTALDAYTSVATRPSSQDILITDNSPDDLSELEFEGNESTVVGLETILFIGDENDIANGEFVGYETVSAPVTNVVTVGRIYRGLFHTSPKDHAAGVRVWFLGQTGGNLTRASLGAADDEMDIQLRSQSIDAVVSEVSTPIEEHTLENTHQFPLAPRDPILNSNFAPASEDVDTLFATETGFTGDEARALEIEVAPRDWRNNDVLGDVVLPATWIDDTPEFDFVLVLDPLGTPVSTALDSLTQDISSATPKGYVTRNNIIEALGANTVIPATGRVQVTARHNPVEHGVVTNSDKMLFDFTVTSALQGLDELVFGGLALSVESAGVTIGESGDLTFDIHTALPSSGIVQIDVDGGGFTTLIGIGASSAVKAVTAAQVIKLKVVTSGPVGDQFFDIVGSAGSTENGYGVLLS